MQGLLEDLCRGEGADCQLHTETSSRAGVPLADLPPRRLGSGLVLWLTVWNDCSSEGGLQCNWSWHQQEPSPRSQQQSAAVLAS